MPARLSFPRFWWACLAPALLAPAQAADAPAAAPWTVAEEGSTVIDARAKLAWPRCVEGMQWNGSTCTGRPQLLDHGEAMALANARWKAEGLRWRLPRANELKRLVDKTAHPPGLDPQLFPAAPRDWHWSSSANIKTGSFNPYNYGNIMEGRSGDNVGQMNFMEGWAVHLATGETRGDMPKHTKLPVRLVRPAP